MGITNMYPNLPGHLVEFKDGGLQLTSLPDDGSGFKKSLLILGTALDGPINEPVKIDAKTVTQLFGSEVNDKNYPNGATLTKYAKQAFAHGFTDVRCMRVTGTEAKKIISVDSTTETILKEKVTGEYTIGSHPKTSLKVSSLPITVDPDCKPLRICTAVDANREPASGTIANSTGLVRVSGAFTLRENTVSKNAIIYAVYYQQLIKGKDGVAGKGANPFTEAKVGSKVIDTSVERINASDLNDNRFTLPYALNSGVRLYYQPYTRSNDPSASADFTDSAVYPEMYALVSKAEDGISDADAKEKAVDLKVVITAYYGEGENEKKRVLDSSEFEVFESTGVVHIKNTSVMDVPFTPVETPPTGTGDENEDNTDTGDTGNTGNTDIGDTGDTGTSGSSSGFPEVGEGEVDIFSLENEDGADDGKVEIPYTSYTVQYFTYTNEHVCERIDLSEKTPVDSKPEDDVISLMDGGKAELDTIKVMQGRSPINPSVYKIDTTGANTQVVIAAGGLSKGTTITVEYSVNEKTSSEKTVVFRSLYGGEVYNQARVKFEKLREPTSPEGIAGDEYIKITFCKPESKYYSKTEVPFYYKSTDVPTVGQLRDFLKNYELNNVFAIETDDEDITLEDLYDSVCGMVLGVSPSDGENTDGETSVQTLSDAPMVDFVLEGGSNGINPTDEELFVALSGKRNAEGYLVERGAYQILENYHCDYIYPAGAKADKTVIVNGRRQSFQYELALVCAVLTYRTKMTHGFIDVSPNSNTSLVGVQKHVDKLLMMPNMFYMLDNNGDEILDSENQPMDIGWYTSVVVGPDPVMISDTLGTYYGSSAIAYAALVASLKPQSSPMNKALPKVKGMKYKFSNKQMDALIGNRMVCFRLKNEGTATASSVPYCVDAMTAGGPKCDYARMTTVSIVTDVVDQIREVADPFIGEPNTIEQRNALSALIAKRLSRIYEQGEVTYYSFEINATIQQVLLGECTISLTLVCPMELRKITTVVSLRAAA